VVPCAEPRLLNRAEVRKYRSFGHSVQRRFGAATRGNRETRVAGVFLDVGSSRGRTASRTANVHLLSGLVRQRVQNTDHRQRGITSVAGYNAAGWTRLVCQLQATTGDAGLVSDEPGGALRIDFKFRWIRRYAESVTAENGLLPVTDQLIIDFCRSLLNSGTPVWQRLQAVRAIGTYRSLVPETQQPDLASIIQNVMN
jgi:hypothetical protein